MGDFVADNGAKLPGIARARFVKYVVSDRFLTDQALRRTAERTTRRTSKRTCSTRRLHATCPPGRPVPSGSR
ncbi:MAG: hypothetical protein ACLUYV_01975 [Alistipes shahii]